MNTNIRVISVLRGLAALMVCLYHFICSPLITDNSILSFFEFGKKGVQIFFIISGIVIPLSMIGMEYSINKMVQFLKVRFIRVEPPYLIAVLFGVLYLNVRNYIPTSSSIDVSPTVKEILLHIGYLIPFFEGTRWVSNVFWTLSVEFQYYLFVALLLPFFLNKKDIFRHFFVLVLLSCPIFTIYLTDDINIRYRFFPFWSSYFGIGIVYAFYITKRIHMFHFFIYSFFLFSIVIICQGFVDFLIALFIILTIHFFKNFTFKLGEFFGNISYSLYLVHTFTGLAFINLMTKMAVNPFGKFVLEIIALCFTILFSYFFWKYVERPSQHFSRNFKNKLSR
jgi:peptidoglycan/LPS O-acetylase OafA/YrhL